MSALAHAAFKDLSHELLREAGLQIIPDYVEKVLNDGNIEDKRKAVDLIMRVTGAEADKKQDPNSNLPVFNFTFNAVSGSVQATVVQEAQPSPLTDETLAVIDVVAKEVAEAPPALEPVTFEASTLDEMLGGLDAMLGSS